MNLADVLRFFFWMTRVTIAVVALAVGTDFFWMRIVTLAFGTCLSFLLVWSYIEFFPAWQAYT